MPTPGFSTTQREMTVSGIFSLPANTSHTVRLMIRQSGGGAAGTNIARFDSINLSLRTINTSLVGLTGPTGSVGPTGAPSTVTGPAGPTGPTGPAGPTGSTPVKLTSQTLTAASWVLVGSYYTYAFSNVNVTTTCDVSVTPQNASYQTAYNAQVLPFVGVAAGVATLYSQFPPAANMLVDIVITQTT